MPSSQSRLKLAGQRLTFRGWSLLAGSATVVVVAYSTGWRALLYIGATLLVLVLLSVVWARSRSGRLIVERRISPDLVAAASTATVTLSVRNPTWIPRAAGLWRDDMPDELGQHSWRPLPPIPAGVTQEARVGLSYTIEAQRRGRFTVGPFAIQGSDPFGLSVHERTSGSVDELLVLPRIFALGGTSASPIAASDAAVRSTMMGRGQDDVIAREYRAGDALRHVHWRASAHRGELMVRQEQRHDDARAIVLLDNRREHWATVAAFEWAVSFAASIIAHLSTEGTGATLVLTAPESTNAYDRATPRESLIELATVARRTAEPGADYLDVIAGLQGEGPAPVFAIMGRMFAPEWRELALHRAPHSAAAAIIVDGGEAPEVLWNAGWRAVPVLDESVDMAEVWRSASMGSARV